MIEQIKLAAIGSRIHDLPNASGQLSQLLRQKQTSDGYIGITAQQIVHHRLILQQCGIGNQKLSLYVCDSADGAEKLRGF